MPSLTHPDEGGPLARLWQHDDETARRVAVRCGIRVLSHAELLALAEATAAQLLDAGVQPDDLVAIACPDAADWLVACCAVLRAGAVVVPADSEPSAAALAALARAGVHVVLSPDGKAGETSLRLTVLGGPKRRPGPPRTGLAVFAAGTTAATLTRAELAARVPKRVAAAGLRPGTTLVYTLTPSQDAAALVQICLSVLSAGGSIHFSDALTAPEALDLVAAVQATDLAADAALLMAVRRLIESELAVSPLYLLAAFESLQQDETRTPAERRRLLSAHHARFGSRLTTLHPCGAPLGPEPTRFFTRMGIDVLDEPPRSL